MPRHSHLSTTLAVSADKIENWFCRYIHAVSGALNVTRNAARPATTYRGSARDSPNQVATIGIEATL